MRSGLLYVSFGTLVARLIDVRPATAALVLGLAASAAACASPDTTPSGTPAAQSRTVTLWASAAPAQPRGMAPSRLAVRPGPVCAGPAGIAKPATSGRQPIPDPQPTRADPQPDAADPQPDAADPQPSTEPEAAARARRALEAANPPVPRRGPVPADAAAVAESCARILRLELTLLIGGRGGRPAEPALRRTLARQGLSGIAVGDESAFAASTGAACVHGVFTAEGPQLSIGPIAANRTCSL
jgi:hypothetical protein